MAPPAGRQRLALAVTVLLSTAACSTPSSQRAGFGSYAGVLGCAEVVAWGTVTGSVPGADGLDVGFDVQRWIWPVVGAASVTFVADDPAREVAAPAWPASEEVVLLVLSDVGPPQRLAADEGARAVAQWRGAGSQRTPREQCEHA